MALFRSTGGKARVLALAAGPPPFVRTRDLVLTLALSAGYLLLSHLLIGFRPEQLVLVGLFNGLYYASRASRRFIIGFSVFLVYWIVFDYMKAFPNYRYNTVHIGSLYAFDKSLFGIRTAAGILSPNEFFLLHHWPWMDVLAGLFYLCWVPVPLGFAGWLYYRDKSTFVRFTLCFLLVNLIGFALYYVYPAAAPWYVQQYGFTLRPGTPGNVAGLGRFDAALGIRLFGGMYAKSSNVFAAMPSLHSAYPVVTLYYVLKSRSRKWLAPALLVMGGIWFSAVYTSHHYVSDVLAGITCAVMTILIFERRLRNWRPVRRYQAAISSRYP